MMMKAVVPVFDGDTFVGEYELRQLPRNILPVIRDHVEDSLPGYFVRLQGPYSTSGPLSWYIIFWELPNSQGRSLP